MYAMAHGRNRRGTVRLAAVSLAMLLAACSAQSSPSESQHPVTGSRGGGQSAAATATGESLDASLPPGDVDTIAIRNRSFGAPEVTVAVGNITFINEDTLPHTVTEGQNGAAAPNARFDKVVGVGESVEVTFAQPGDYQITCLFHSEMHLLVHAH